MEDATTFNVHNVKFIYVGIAYKLLQSLLNATIIWLKCVEEFSIQIHNDNSFNKLLTHYSHNLYVKTT